VRQTPRAWPAGVLSEWHSGVLPHWTAVCPVVASQLEMQLTKELHVGSASQAARSEQHEASMQESQLEEPMGVQEPPLPEVPLQMSTVCCTSSESSAPLSFVSTPTWMFTPPAAHVVPGGMFVSKMREVAPCAPCGPFAPCGPCGPVAPVAPCGPCGPGGNAIGVQAPETHATSCWVDVMYATWPAFKTVHSGRLAAVVTASSVRE